jgi:hypothetical protein
MQANFAANYQMIATDSQQAQTIYTQISANATKSQMERQKLMQDTQTKIFEITQDITTHKAKTADKAAAALDAYIRG